MEPSNSTILFKFAEFCPPTKSGGYFKGIRVNFGLEFDAWCFDPTLIPEGYDVVVRSLNGRPRARKLQKSTLAIESEPPKPESPSSPGKVHHVHSAIHPSARTPALTRKSDKI